MVGPHGRVIIVTRQPENPVLRALTLADASAISGELAHSLDVLGYGPPSAVAVVSGAGAFDIADGLSTSTGEGDATVTRVGPPAGPFLVVASSSDALADAFADVPRPPERVRVEVDPVRW